MPIPYLKRELAALAAIIVVGASGVARAAVCPVATTLACGGSTTVTYNGVPMMLYGAETNGTVRSEIWYLVAPTTGAHNVVVTAPNTTDVTATSMSFTGVNQASPLGTMAHAIGTSATPSLSVMSAIGEPIYDVLGAVGSTLPTVTGNQTLRRNNATTVSPVVIGSSTAAGQTTPVTMSWSIPSADWAMVAVPIHASTALTAVGIDSFTATWDTEGVQLQWQGGYEPSSAGFFVYRSEGGGQKIQLNTDIIPGDAIIGHSSSYSWTDQTAGSNGPVTYWLKDVKVDGSFTWYGPASPIALGATTPARPPVPVVQGADGGAASEWKIKSETNDGMGGCALADRTGGRAGLQLALLLGMIISARRRKHRLLLAALFFAGAVAANLGMPRPVAAAGGVSVDATATGTGGSGLTFSHTMGAGSNGLLVVGVVTPIICETTATDPANCGGCGSTCPLSIASSIDSGLLGMWHLNEGSGATSADSSGNGNTATLTGNPGWVTGYSNNALRFNGSTSTYAEAAIGSWFGSNNTLSVSAWVYATATTNGPIFGVTSTVPPGGWNMPFLSINGSTAYVGLWNGGGGVYVSATVSPLNAWHHLAMTYDPAGSGTRKFYVDGVLSATTTVTYGPSNATDYWSTYISGDRPGGVNPSLNGIIDEVRAYNRVLTAGEVSALATARLSCSGGACAGCPGSQTVCSSSCVDTLTDSNNCGGCGTTCNAAGGETCIGGMCNCASGTDCSSFCVATASDPNNCGGCAMPCSAATPAGVDSGLLSHWHLSEGSGATTADSSGNGHTATLTGSPTWTTAGYAGNALTFDGSSNYAEGPLGTWFGSNNTLSVSAWVYATSTTNGPIFGVTNQVPPGNWNMPFLSINGSTVYVGLWNGAGTYVSATVSLNAWHYLAMTYDPAGSGTRKFYVDGTLSATTTVTYTPSNGFDYWSTYNPGDTPAGVNKYLRGTIDEIRAYNRVLSAAEVQLIYYARQTCSGGMCNGCQNSETLCSSVCTNTNIDSGNCGACGNTCNTAGGESCIAGACGCASGTHCGSTCVDTATNQSNCGSCGNVCGAVTCGSCDSGLVGKWLLDEGAGATSADSSGNGNNATLTGSPTWTTGHTGSGLQFNGTTNSMTAPLGAWFGQNNTLSASVWVFATSTTRGPIFGVASQTTGWNMPFLSIDGSTAYGWLWAVNGNTPLTATVSLNAWHLLTITYDPASGGTERFFVDGALAATGTGTYDPSLASDNLTTIIGGAKPASLNGQDRLIGLVDDFRAYKRVLSAGEIALLYNAQTSCVSGSCGTCPTGTTSCTGACTNTAADNSNCSMCGTVCSGGTPNCVASVCQ